MDGKDRRHRQAVPQGTGPQGQAGSAAPASDPTQYPSKAQRANLQEICLEDRARSAPQGPAAVAITLGLARPDRPRTAADTPTPPTAAQTGLQGSGTSPDFHKTRDVGCPVTAVRASARLRLPNRSLTCASSASTVACLRVAASPVFGSNKATMQSESPASASAVVDTIVRGQPKSSAPAVGFRAMNCRHQAGSPACKTESITRRQTHPSIQQGMHHRPGRPPAPQALVTGALRGPVRSDPAVDNPSYRFDLRQAAFSCVTFRPFNANERKSVTSDT